MERISRVVGPVATNVYVLADPRSREAIAIDTAIPSLDWVAEELAARDWTLRLIVTTHGHWDHFGDNAAVQAHTGADIAVTLATALGWRRRSRCGPRSDSAVRAGGRAPGGRRDPVRRNPAAGPPHPRPHRGSVCLYAADDGLLFSGDTLFAGAWGRTDLPGGDPVAMVESLIRLLDFEDPVRVLPGHNRETTIGAERPWLELVRNEGRLLG